MLTLLGYWRSSAAYRVRIALNLKGLAFDNKSINLVNRDQFSAEYSAQNPTHLVPTLIDDTFCINQSMAILEYLEEKYPDTPLLPTSLEDKTIARALANDIACDIHPLNNLRVLQYLSENIGVTDVQKAEWYSHWITKGFEGIEAKLANTAGTYCFGDSVTFADLCLVPQVYNARRFKVSLDDFPRIEAIDAACATLDAFINAAPEHQPDATA